MKNLLISSDTLIESLTLQNMILLFAQATISLNVRIKTKYWPISYFQTNTSRLDICYIFKTNLYSDKQYFKHKAMLAGSYQQPVQSSPPSSGELRPELPTAPHSTLFTSHRQLHTTYFTPNYHWHQDNDIFFTNQHF